MMFQNNSNLLKNLETSPKNNIIKLSRSPPKVSISLLPSSVISIESKEIELDDYGSTKTAHTMRERSSSPTFSLIQSQDQLMKEHKTIGNLCKNYKQKDLVIQRLNLRISTLTQQNKLLNQMISNIRNSKGSKQGGGSYSQEQSTKVKYLQLLIKEKEGEYEELTSRHQHETNLLYSSMSDRLKAKEIECYNISKKMKQDKIIINDLQMTIKKLQEKQAQNLKAYSLRQSQFRKNLEQNIKYKQQIDKRKVEVSRLKYSEKQLIYLQEDYLKQKSIIQKITSQLARLNQQKTHFQRQVSAINIIGHDASKLVLRMMELQDELRLVRSSKSKQQDSLRMQLKISEGLLLQSNNIILKEQIHRVNCTFRNRIF